MAAKKPGTLRRDPGHPARTPNPFADLEPPSKCEECGGSRSWLLAGRSKPEALCLACVRFLPPTERREMRLIDTPLAYLWTLYETVNRAGLAVGDLLAFHADELTAPGARLARTGEDLTWIRMTLERLEDVILARKEAFEADVGWNGERVDRKPVPYAEASWLRHIPGNDLDPDLVLYPAYPESEPEPDAIVTRKARG